MRYSSASKARSSKTEAARYNCGCAPRLPRNSACSGSPVAGARRRRPRRGSRRVESGQAAGPRDRRLDIGAAMLLATLEAGLGSPRPQVGEPTYADKITPEDLHLDWARPAGELARVPRVGRAWTTFRGKRLLVLEAHAVAEGP